MYRGPSKHFKVVYSHEKQYAIWHAEAAIRLTWQETGRYGSERECWDFVETREGNQGHIFRFPDRLS